MDDLHNELKKALDYFDLRWCDKDKVAVRTDVAKVTSTFDGRSIPIHTL